MSRSLVLLSGEGTTIPAAEAKALFLTYDPSSRFSSPEDRVLIAESRADPDLVSRRIAFARRVGTLVDDISSVASKVKGRSIRLRRFTLGSGSAQPEVYSLLDGLDVSVNLRNPDFEFTQVCGRRSYLLLTKPSAMRQSWSLRRPRRRAFFHPSAIFPKLSRALVNLTRCKERDLLLDPFCGTGSIPIEASEIGIDVIAIDRSAEMVRGALSNMKLFRQTWQGVMRADAFRLPLREVDAIATDVPYGRAASTGGRSAEEVMAMAIELLPSTMKKDSIMVLVHPENQPLEPTGRLSLLDEHRLYVHKRLTRVITILRKK